MPWRSRAIPRSTPRTAVAVIALCLAAMLAPGLPASAASARGTDLTLPVTDGPLHNQHITIHARIYYPQHTPAPAVLISPGFGGTVNSLDAEAEQLLGDGFVVLTYTPRGFGRSGGRIALNDPDYEVSDAHQLVNWLATRPQVQLDAPGDPRIGVTGASYGGALSLLLAGTDKRIDAIAPLITYNNLATALVPNSAGNRIPASTPAAGASGADGVFKKSWAGNLFAIGLAGRRSARPGCGAFTAAVCAAYTQLATSGRPDASTLALLRHDSPASVTGRIT
ncbi:MAG: alpha/beta hydrolase, partial [Sciscionella sp.]